MELKHLRSFVLTGEAVYASLTTGFSKMYNDAAILMDATKEFSTYGFPQSMNVEPFLLVNLFVGFVKTKNNDIGTALEEGINKELDNNINNTKQ